MGEIEDFLKESTTTGPAYLVAENAQRSKAPAEILRVLFIQIAHIHPSPVLCFQVMYRDNTKEFVPVSPAEQKIINSHQRDYYCRDCNSNTLENVYYDNYEVQPELWQRFGVKRGRLCINCLQFRMGRQLTLDDFTDSVNNNHNRLIKEIRANLNFTHASSTGKNTGTVRKTG